MKIALLLLCYLVLLSHACGRKSGESQTAGQSGATQTPIGSPNTAMPATYIAGLDACSLIKKSEVAALQGAQVQSVVPNTERNGELVISQCYFTVNSPDGSKNLSVHVQVTQADPRGSNPKAVKDHWERSFRKSEGAGNKKGTDGEPIAGIGEEAFWVGDNKMGVLYALKKDKLIRLSVGGPHDAKTRLDKSKKLVAKAIERLS